MRDYSRFEHAEFPPSYKLMLFSEEMLDLRFGLQMREYLLKYGYLASGDVEFYGLNGRQGPDSDLVVQTVTAHAYFPETRGYVMLESLGDGRYAMVGPADEVCTFDRDLRRVSRSDDDLDAYLDRRLREGAAA